MKSGFFKKFTAAVLCFSLIFLMNACAEEKHSLRGPFSPAVVSTPQTLRSSSYENVRKYSSGGNTLLFDENTMSAAVVSGGKKWTSLPAENGTPATVFWLTAVYNGEIYTLNSQDNSAACGGAVLTKTGSGFSVSYEVFPDALKTFSIRLTLDYELTPGGLAVSTDTRRWESSDGVFVTSFTLLPYFGALAYDSPGIDPESDFICLPDGSGALVYTKKADASMLPMSFDVYTGSVIAPVFGVKNEASAFACVTVAGDECLNIDCDVSGKYKTVFNRFTLASFSADGKKCVREYSGELRSVYSFTSGEYLSFADISAAARSVFFKYGILTDTCESAHNYVFLEFSDAAGNVLADMTGAQSLLGLMKGKGIDDVRLICDGIYGDDGGFPDLTAGEEFGGAEGLSELCSYAMTRGGAVYVSCFTNTLSGKNGSCKDISGNMTGGSFSSGARFSARTGKQEKYLETLLGSGAFPAGCGCFLADASNGLVSAGNDSGSTAGDLAAVRRKTSEALADRYGTLSAGGSFLSLSGTDGIISVPASCAGTVTGVYADEPFVLAVLHGCTEYTGPAVNTAEIPQLSVLRAVEYGMSPCLSFTCYEARDDYYAKVITDYSDYLSRFSVDLSRSVKLDITDHYCVQSGVYCTEFGGNTVVYTNYNNFSAVLGDIVVPPYDWLVLG